MKFICVQPATLYYAWQVEVMLNNFLEMGVNPSDIQILCAYEHHIPNEWKKMMSYPVGFYFYKDTRESRAYVSSIRPNVLKQHFERFPELEQEAIFYHDCDIIFTRPITWITEEMQANKNWYGSDTKSYIGYDYVKSKGDEVINLMCRTMNVTEQQVKDNDNGVIGAQILLKGVNSDFWDNVQRDSEMLYVMVTNLNARIKHKNPEYHELQIWCADMWAILWGAWREGFKTISDPLFDFAWASAPKSGKDKISDYERCNIMHNAGVTSGKDGYFYKGDFIDKLPYDAELDLKEGASKEYFNWVNKVGKISKLK